MSKLRTYRSKHCISQADFAKRVGALQSTISKIEAGLQVPSLELAVKIERETAGEVVPSDWVEISDGSAAA